MRVSGDGEVGQVASALVRALESHREQSAQGTHQFGLGFLVGRQNDPARRSKDRLLEDGVSALFREWGRLPRTVREAALAGLGGFGVKAARRWIGDADVGVRVSLVRFAAECGGAALHDVVLDGLLDAEPRVGNAAEASLVRVCESIAGLPMDRVGERSEFEAATGWVEAVSVADRARLRERVAWLCESFPEHRRRGVLESALALLDPGVLAFGTDVGADPLAKWLLDDTQPSHPALRSMLRRGTGALTRRRAWEWLNRPVVLAAALDRVARADTDAEHEAVLGASHLLENPVRAARWALTPVQCSAGGGPIPSVERLGGLSVVARRGYARLVIGVRVGPEQLEQGLMPVLTDEDDATRLSAVRALPGPAVLDYSFDRSESVALAATLKWVHASSSARDKRVASNLARSPHARVRWIGAQEMEPRATRRDTLRGIGASSGGAAGAIDELRVVIRSGSPEERFEAVMASRRLCVQRDVEPELLGLVGGDRDRALDERWSRAVGAAVSALGEAGSESAREAVWLCLAHPVARVRSNSAESLVWQARGRGDLPSAEPRLYESLIEMKDDASHRVRSSAVRAVLRAASPEWGGTGYDPVAADELVRMLEDSRPMHRLAGLWAVEHATASAGDSVTRRWEGLASRVAELAREETDDAVQRRAMWCARRMLWHSPDARGALAASLQECAA